MDNKRSFTVDSFFDGAIFCKQNKDGYRFSLDAVLAAHFPRFQKSDTVLDLGCGCGIIGIILIYRWKHLLKKVVGLEIQPSLAQLAKENIEVNGFTNVMHIVEGDIEEIGNYFKAESFSKVICNPPFYKTSRGRRNVNQEAYIARHQVKTTLEKVIDAARFCVQNRGYVTIIYPAEGIAELIGTLRSRKLEPKRIQLIYSHQEDETAQLVLIDSMKNGGEGAKLIRPLYIYSKKNGPYSKDMQKMYDIEPNKLSDSEI